MGSEHRSQLDRQHPQPPFGGTDSTGKSESSLSRAFSEMTMLSPSSSSSLLPFPSPASLVVTSTLFLRTPVTGSTVVRSVRTSILPSDVTLVVVLTVHREAANEEAAVPAAPPAVAAWDCTALIPANDDTSQASLLRCVVDVDVDVVSDSDASSASPLLGDHARLRSSSAANIVAGIRIVLVLVTTDPRSNSGDVGGRGWDDDWLAESDIARLAGLTALLRMLPRKLPSP
mmetsp:Transcript_60987/g.180524  ORF Transcript_60987/g.180524 Transcript_60987/m.180524 type:complete len:230 (-) Transcript_60987:155-844(-)